MMAETTDSVCAERDSLSGSCRDIVGVSPNVLADIGGGGSIGVVPAVDFSVLGSADTELRILREQRCNVLLEGAVADTDAALHALRSRFDEPLRCSQPLSPVHLPADGAGSFILRDAASLSRDDQRRVLDWMNDAGWETQIVSTAARPLFELVSAGLFDAALYYRLNILLLRVGPPSSILARGSLPRTCASSFTRPVH